MSDDQSASGAPSIEERVLEIINNEIRPAIQMDGGDIALVGIDENNVVNVQLKGACVGCPGAVMTLQMGVERRLKQLIPEIQGVVSV